MTREINPIQDGVCNLCGTQIWTDPPRKRPNMRYAEFSMLLSNGTVARTSICTSCAPNLKKKDAEYLLERIKMSWIASMVGSSTDKQFDAVRAITLDDYDHDDKKMHKRAKEVKKEKHIAKLEEAKKKLKKNKNK